MTALRLFLAIVAWIALPAQALDYRSVGTSAAVLFDAPSTQGKPLFVVARGYPLEVVVSVDNWLKVRDSNGALAWIETGKITARRMLVVTAAQAEIHDAALAGAAVFARAEKGVLLEWQASLPGGWVRARLPDNRIGYVRLNQVWGA